MSIEEKRAKDGQITEVLFSISGVVLSIIASTADYTASKKLM